MFAKLTSLLGGASLPYTLGDLNGSSWGHWQHFSAKKNDDQSVVSVFKLTCSGPNDRMLHAARNGIKRMKTLRHPSILAYRDSMEIEERAGVTVYLVTEPCRPLKETLGELVLPPGEKDEFMSMGLRQICSAIGFLNNDVHVIHGNVSLGAIVITDGMDWKLAALDLTTDHAQAGALESPLQASSWLVGAQYKSAELARMDWAAVASGPPWAVDAWGLGCLIQEIFSGAPLARTEDLRNTGAIPPTLLPEYQKLLATAPAKRLDPQKMVHPATASAFLQGKVTVELVDFLENLAIKDSNEREAYFRRLHTQLAKVPLPVAIHKILPATTSALELGMAPAAALTAVLQIGARMTPADFDKRLVPALVRLFASQDRALRKALLENVDTYLPHLSASVLEEQVYPQLANGFTDQAPYLREITLKSMVNLAPRLSQKTLNNSLLKYLAKLQVDEEPSIRANTNILLGSIAPHMGEAACKRVLLNAFTRALKDSFAPSRTAALRALAVTPQYYSAEEVATRVLPAIGPLAVDGDRDVRVACMQCLAVMVKLLQDNHDGVATAVAAAPDAGAQGGGGYLAWAFGGATGTATATPAVAAPAAAPAPILSQTSLSAAPFAAGPNPAAPAPVLSQTSLNAAPYTTAAAAPRSGMSLGATRAAAPAAPAGISDGWGDEEDDDLLGAPIDMRDVHARVPAAPVAPVQSERQRQAQNLFAGVTAGPPSTSSITARRDAAPASFASAPAAPAPAPLVHVPKPVDDLFAALDMASGPPVLGGTAKPRASAAMKQGAMKLGAQKLG